MCQVFDKQIDGEKTAKFEMKAKVESDLVVRKCTNFRLKGSREFC